jgi:CheY-like chemotaxis protein
MNEQASVLVVDDNADLLQTFSLILKRRGYDVDTAGDGLSALDKFRSRRFDVTLMDIVMPQMNGVEAFRRMREINPGAKVILMTAYYEDEQIRMALKDGAYSALHKPIDVARLIELIKEATLKPPVLVVDDDGDLCQTIASLLKLEGYQVEAVSSGEEAIRIAQERPFSIAFIDVKMPIMDGLETYLRLKEINPDIRAIMMTGYREEMRETVAKALAAEAATCLYKPFDPSAVVGLVDEIVGQ